MTLEHPISQAKSRATHRNRQNEALSNCLLSKHHKFCLDSRLRQEGAGLKAGGHSLAQCFVPVAVMPAGSQPGTVTAAHCNRSRSSERLSGGFWHQRVCAALIKVLCSVRITSPGTEPGLYWVTPKHGFSSQLSNCSHRSHHCPLCSWTQPWRKLHQELLLISSCHPLTGSSFSTHSTPSAAGAPPSPISPKQMGLSSTTAWLRAEHRVAL